MPFIEVLTLELGSSIAKSILKLWLKDHPVTSDASASILDVLKSYTSDKIAQKRAQRQFEIIGEKVGENLIPIFEIDGARLDDGSRTAIVLAAVETLSATTSVILAQQNLEPPNLAKYLLNVHPAEKYHFSETEKLLYERIVSESCHHIVDIASQLPTFTENTFAEILKRENQLIDITEKILQEVQRMREQINPRAEAARFELEYRHAVVRNLDFLQLFGVDFASASRRHRLSVAYVTLSVERKSRPDYSRSRVHDTTYTAELEISRDQAHRSIISVDEALASSRRLLIRGIAGSGKTTLLQWIAMNSASRSFKENLMDWNNTVPFIIRLRRCVQSGFPAPETFPNFITNIITGTMPSGWVHAELNAGRAIVLIDGLDEIPVLQRENVHTWLNDLVATYPKARFIVTTRPYAVEEGWMYHEGFSEAELQPMELSDIRAFIDHWHDAVAKELQDEQEKAKLPSFAEHLKEEIIINHAKRNLATSPLLCAMLCALNRERQALLPSDRIELYEACCRMLIDRRDPERGISHADYPAHVLTYPQKYALLADLAYWLMKNGWSEIELQRVDERFERKLTNMLGVQQSISGVDVRRFLVERTSIIREPLVGYIDFTHRTFQEYLSARAVAEEGDIGLLIQHANNDQWSEVIILTPGCVSGIEREKLLRELIRRGDAEMEHRYQLHLLAVSCLETAVQLEESVKLEVEKRLSKVVPPEDMTHAKALAAAGELAVKHLAKKEGLSDSVTAACVRTLGIIGGDAALEKLQDYAHTSSSIVLDELFRAWNSFNKEIYAQRILFRAVNEGCNVPYHFSSLDGFQYFTDLTSLNLSSCKQISDFSLLANLHKLKALNLSGCIQINDLSFLSDLTDLTSLNLSHCGQIIDLHPLSNLIQLTSLDLSNCGQVRDLSPLLGLTQMTSLNLSNCEMVNVFTSLVKLTQLTSLQLSNCRKIDDLNFLTSFIKLTSLDLSNCRLVQDFGPLMNLTSLVSLNLSGCDQLNDLNSLIQLNSLTLLDLSNCWRFSDLYPLTNLTHLTSLNLSDCTRTSNLLPLTTLNNLTSLNLSGCGRVKDLEPLASLICLTLLQLSRCEQISDLTPLEKLIQLTSLDLSFCTQVSNLAPLGSLPNLRSLNLTGCSELSLSSLSGLTHLTSLNLSGLTHLHDLTHLANLAHLTSINLSNCPQLRDLSNLKALNNLQELILSKNFDSSNIPPYIKANIKFLP